MSAQQVPAGFQDIGEWIMFHLYDYPNASHMTQSLLQHIQAVLKDQSTTLENVNALRVASGQEALAELAEAEAAPDFNAVQRAVESLIVEGFIKGDRMRLGTGGVYFVSINLTPKGEIEAIRQMRKREAGAKAVSELIEQAAQ